MASTDLPAKNIVLVKKLDGVLYKLIIETDSDMVYYSGEDTTLTEKLSDIIDTIRSIKETNDTFDNKFSALMKGAPDTFKTFKEVWDYVNVNGNPESELIKLVDSKVTKKDGYGLSQNDLTDVLAAKLKNGYTKEQLDEKFEIIDDNVKGTVTVHDLDVLKEELNNQLSKISSRLEIIENKPNIELSSNQPTDISDQSSWFQLVSSDTDNTSSKTN